MPKKTQVPTKDLKTYELRVRELPSAIHRRLKMVAAGSGKSNSEVVIDLLDDFLPEFPAEVSDAA